MIRRDCIALFFWENLKYMPKISYKDQCVNTLDGEKMLDAFLRQGISIPFSCRDGVCHSCKQIAVEGSIPVAAQKGLTSAQCEQGYFLPCSCIPTEDMVIMPPQDAKFYVATIVQGKEMLAPDIYKLLLEPTLAQSCQSGQYICVRNTDGEERSFAIVNQPADDFFLEIHVSRGAGDSFSSWVFEKLEIEGELEIQGPYEEAPTKLNEPREMPSSIPYDGPNRRKDPPPDMELWAALQEGKLMLGVLQDFYGRVYKDDLLSPYFHGITMQRSIEKVYSFFQQVMTGQKCYFGDRPRNAHHWMVISEETYQYREELMIECLRRAGLSEEMVKRWIAIENHYKHMIVKSVPWKKMVGGVELPLDGFGDLVMDVGAMCDGCGRVVEVGETVRYHLRLGTVYCALCNGQVAVA